MTSIFSDLVGFFGGQVATARALGVTQGTVSGWIRGIHGCSADVAFLAQARTGGRFKADQLRPSLAESLPTLDQTIRGRLHGDQSSENAGILSSTGEASS